MTASSLHLAAGQLSRMRGMTRYYHGRFFANIRFATAAALVLFVLGFAVDARIFLLVPVVSLIGALSTAFDASYLVFARQYAARLEAYLNAHGDDRVLVAGELENAYLFPLDTPKLVVADLRLFSWFSFMTLAYTAIGAATFVFGLALGWPALLDAGAAWTIAYLVSLAAVTLAGVIVGVWWFVLGAGEARLRGILDARFG